MASTLKLPVGIDDFRKLQESHFYYVDKTRLIEQLLLNWSEVTLFTRPRRFGKTLNMSMLKSFFDIGTDKALFDGLYISGNKELCDEYMGKYPVIFLSLKGVEGSSFDDARYMITEHHPDGGRGSAGVLHGEARRGAGRDAAVLHGKDVDIRDSVR